MNKLNNAAAPRMHSRDPYRRVKDKFVGQSSLLRNPLAVLWGPTRGGDSRAHFSSALSYLVLSDDLHEQSQHSTTTAAFARDDPAPAANSFTPPGVVGTTSSVTTPGLEIPGAYPSDTRGAINTQGITEAAKNAVNTVTTTAQQYLPVAQETAAQAAQRAAAAASQATQTASSYLSNTAVVGGSTVRASAADHPHETSLPSTETTGALPQEHVGGAGALPGSVRETAVTKLPDERSIKGDSAIYPTNTYPSTAPPDVLSPASQQSSAISPLAGSTVPATTAFTALAPSGTPHSHPQDTSVTLRDSLPSQEATGQAPYTHQDG
ncbi:hypothetical protein EVJ58_g1393, partial [Rhodofomes roseus]